MHVGFVDLLWEGHHTPYIVYLSQYFTDRGHEVTFITDEANPRLDELPDASNLTVRALSLPTTDVDPTGGMPESLWEQIVRSRQLRRIFITARAEHFDILHLLYFNRTQLPLWAISRRGSHPPIVGTLHRDFFTDANPTGWGKRLTQAAIQYALNTTLADGSLACLTVHADTIRDRVIEHVPAADLENTRTIPAPTPELSVDAGQEEAREHLDLPANGPIALFFGGLRHEKGPDLLANAVRNLGRPLTVVFAGPPEDFTENDVQRWQQEANPPVQIIDRVEFIPEEELDYYFLAADVLVLPYRRQRGISGPLRRACAAGTPVIGKTESDIGSLIEENCLGWTFTDESPTSLRTALETFLVEGDTYPTENLAQYASDHHWEETGRSVEAIYQEVLKNTGSHPDTSLGRD